MTTEEVWHHALQFLDKYRLGLEECDVAQLYHLPGKKNEILEAHRGALADLFREQQIDIKILYAELIRSLIGEEREAVEDKNKYEATRAVGKIEGYQELTNRLQRILNQQFIMDIAKLKIEKENNEMGTVWQRLEKLEKTCGTMKQDTVNLENTNQKLVEEIEELKTKLRANANETENDNYKKQKDILLHIKEETTVKDKHNASDDKISSLYQQFSNQDETLGKLENQISIIMNQANILLINDAQQSEQLSCLETKSSDCEAKLNELESADLYLQESHQMLAKRTERIEKTMAQNLKSAILEGQKEATECSNVVKSIQDQISDEKGSVESSTRPKSIDRLSILDDKVNQLICLMDQPSKMISTETRLREEVTSRHNTEVNQNLFILQPEGGAYGQYQEDTVDNSQYEALKQKIHALEKEISDKRSDRLILKEFQQCSSESRTLEKTTTFNTVEDKKNGIMEEVEHLHRILNLMAGQDKATTLQLLRMEHSLVTLQDTKNYYRFIEMVGGLDRSLNQLVGDFLEWQQELKSLQQHNKNMEVGQEDQRHEVDRQKEVMEGQKQAVERLSEDLESIKKKEAIDFEEVYKRTEALENIISQLKAKKKKNEKFFEVKKSSNSKITIDEDEAENLLGPGSKQNRWLGNWFTKQNSGSLCC